MNTIVSLDSFFFLSFVIVLLPKHLLNKCELGVVVAWVGALFKLLCTNLQFTVSASFPSLLPQKAKSQQCWSPVRVKFCSTLPASHRCSHRSSYWASREITGKSTATASDSLTPDRLHGWKEKAPCLWLSCVYMYSLIASLQMLL